jgi:hypothetical protein
MTSYEPKRNNRFIVEFPEEFNITTFTVQKVSHIKFEYGSWNDIKITFVDPISLSSSRGLLKIIDFINTTPQKKDNALFKIKIKLLEATGKEIECWNIIVKEVLSIDLGGFDYSDDGLKQPKILLRPLSCSIS